MAPVALAVSDWTTLWSSSVEVCTVSILFLVLVITLLAVCVRCQRKGKAQVTPENGKAQVQNGASTSQKTSTAPNGTGHEGGSFTTWKDHKSMPEMPDIPIRTRAFYQIEHQLSS